MHAVCLMCGLYAVHGYVETASVIAVLNYADQTSDDIVGHSLYRTQFKVNHLGLLTVSRVMRYYIFYVPSYLAKP